MQGIIDFLGSIINALNSVIQFVVNFVKDIIYLVQITAKFLAEIPNYFGWLPSVVSSSIVLIFTIVVIYKVLGREG